MIKCQVVGCPHLIAPDDKRCAFCTNALRRQREAEELCKTRPMTLKEFFDHLAPVKPEVPVRFAAEC